MRKASLSFSKRGYLSLEETKGSDVPKGHLPVYVGTDRSRFIIPATHLNHPLFRQLLEKIEEEFGFDHEMGLFIPCEESAFECLISLLDAQKSQKIDEPRSLVDSKSSLVC